MGMKRENQILRARLERIASICDRWGRNHSSGLKKIARIAKGEEDDNMTWQFHERLSASTSEECDRFTTACLNGYFGRFDRLNSKIEIDRGERAVPYSHDLEVVVRGERYKIEQKHRPTKDYGDELLEHVSNDVSGRLGWTWRASSVDYVLFTYPTSRRYSIWPGPALEATWRANHEDWIARFGIRAARNPGYSTLNVPIPTETLKAALAQHGAPICPTCKRNVGRFRSECDDCGIFSCCAISDGNWLCERCAGADLE